MSQSDRRYTFVRACVLLLALGTAAVFAITAVHRATAARVAANEQHASYRWLRELVHDPALELGEYDLRRLEAGEAVAVCDARGDIAYTLAIGTARGYGGAFRVIVAVQPDTAMLAARTIEQHETKGFDAAMDAQLYASEPLDGVTGATVTTRAARAAAEAALLAATSGAPQNCRHADAD